MHVVTVEQMRRIEAAAVEQGLEYLRLMENAGTAAARFLRERYAVERASVAILCGKGNNGGDGFVIARKLREAGASVTVILADGAPRTEEAIEMFSRLDRSVTPVFDATGDAAVTGAVLERADLIVDAVYGIGFYHTLPPHLEQLFARLPGRCPLVAIDVPSGLNADTGVAAPHAPVAHATVTFTAAKRGLLTAEGSVHCGEVTVVQIGIDPALVEQIAADRHEIDEADVRACFPPRQPESHKGTYGRLLSVCGSYGMTGAAFFAAKAALRCGVGLVTAALPRSIYPILASMLPEAVFLPLPEADTTLSVTARTALREALSVCNAGVVGCGLGLSDDAGEIVADLIRYAACPLVVDADGITLLARHIDILKTDHAPLILTPHPGEMARLCGCTVEEVQANRQELATRFATEHGVTVVLKGHRTVIALPDGRLWINSTGNPGMATGGSGDVLAGMIGGFLAQGFTSENAAMCGVYLHGLAGDKAAERLSQVSLLPSDLLEELPRLFTN